MNNSSLQWLQLEEGIRYPETLQILINSIRPKKAEIRVLAVDVVHERPSIPQP
jgi:hypothetical protein